MRTLAFDTATRATTVAVCDGAGRRLEARDDPEPGQRPNHVTRLLPMVEEVLEGSGTSWPQLRKIAVGTGPGTFTGLRIGVATARALARARAIPLIGIPTLYSLAFNVRWWSDRAGLDSVLAAIDARRGEVFAACWRVAELGTFDSALLRPRALAPEALAELLAPLGPATLALGDGAVAFREVLERSGALIPEDHSQLHRVTAANHCGLAGGLRGSSPDEVRPQYLRAPDAEAARHPPGRP